MSSRDRYYKRETLISWMRSQERYDEKVIAICCTLNSAADLVDTFGPDRAMKIAAEEEDETVLLDAWREVYNKLPEILPNASLPDEPTDRYYPGDDLPPGLPAGEVARIFQITAKKQEDRLIRNFNSRELKL